MTRKRKVEAVRSSVTRNLCPSAAKTTSWGNPSRETAVPPSTLLVTEVPAQAGMTGFRPAKMRQEAVSICFEGSQTAYGQ
jgi:hypothetical protein